MDTGNSISCHTGGVTMVKKGNRLQEPTTSISNFAWVFFNFFIGTGTGIPYRYVEGLFV
jgi:hypothetical protein